MLMRRRAPVRPRRIGDGGYTLVELLVVLAILGLLAGITVPRVIKYLDGAKVRAAGSAVEGLSSAIDLFRIDVGRLPTQQEGLNALLEAPSSAAGWNGPYIKKRANLTDPWGQPYQYKIPGEHGGFDLFSLGPDGKSDANPKVIGNW